MKLVIMSLMMLTAAAASAQTPVTAPAQTTTAPAQTVAAPTAPVTAQQQPYKFGFLNYRAVFEAMPEYAEAQKSLQEIKAKYDAETAHNEESFKRMYLEFLQGQKDFPQTIMLKRQKELQEAIENGIKFRTQVNELLTKAQADLERPLRQRLDSAIALVGKEKGYDMIVNTSEMGFPYLSRVTGEDVTEAVKQKLAAIKP